MLLHSFRRAVLPSRVQTANQNLHYSAKRNATVRSLSQRRSACHSALAARSPRLVSTLQQRLRPCQAAAPAVPSRSKSDDEEDDIVLTAEELALLAVEDSGVANDSSLSANEDRHDEGHNSEADDGMLAFEDDVITEEEMELFDALDEEELRALAEESADVSVTPATTSYADFNTEDDEESRAFGCAMAKIASDTKGGDIMLLHVAPLVYWTSYMLVVTVFSRPQLNAVLGRMEKEAAQKWKRVLPQHKKPGRGLWEVLDYGDVVIHVMATEEREFYDIESFYGAAEEVDLPFLHEDLAQGPQWKTKV